ncbi:MAG: HigA family addiction module antitoxin [Cyanobacteria bacterium J06588_4]
MRKTKLRSVTEWHTAKKFTRFFRRKAIADLAEGIAVLANRIHAIVNGTRRVTADTDLRLCRYFGLSEGYFLRLQNAYELMEAKRKLGQVLVEIQPYAS